MSDTPILKRRQAQRVINIPAWILRGMLAACLLFASEVIFWTDATRPVWGWGLLVPAYVAVAAVLLDLWVRFRVYDVFGVLVLAGTYGNLAATVLNPAVTLEGLPISLVTRIMGSQTVAGLLGLVLMLSLLRGRAGRGVLIGAAGVGILWGVWVRGGVPLLLNAPDVSLSVMMIAGILGGGLVVLLAYFTRQLPLPDENALKLAPTTWGVMLIVLAIPFTAYLLRGNITREAISYVVTILFLCVTILWFQARPSGTSLIADYLQSAPMPFPMWSTAIVILLAAGAGGYILPPPTTNDEIGILGALSVALGAFGLVWLPAVCLVLGVRAYRTSARTGGKSL